VKIQLPTGTKPLAPAICSQGQTGATLLPSSACSHPSSVTLPTGDRIRSTHRALPSISAIYSLGGRGKSKTLSLLSQGH